MSERVSRYLTRKADLESRPLEWARCDRIEQAVVIPVLAERDRLFETLDTLAANPAEDLRKTLVICVVNNRAEPDARAQDIADNLDTLARLRARQAGDPRLRLGIVDAASPGRELPSKGGVGLARKIGLDWALAVMHESGAPAPLLLSLDADTHVETNYLAAVREHFESRKAWAAVVSYAHRLDGPPEQVAAIICYELFLRYHVLGLAFAGSPYAFPSIGSTMACTGEAYAAVSGMNRRQAGEDFYFLQELAKTGGVDQVFTTTVRPSSRGSHRVPFGTGQRIRRHLDGGEDEYRLYDPRSYGILRAWLGLVATHLEMDGDGLLERAGEAAPALRAYLAAAGFASAWEGLRRNAAGPEQLLRQFHRWMDGFRTMKLVHFLRANGYPECGMFEALHDLLARLGEPWPFPEPEAMRNEIAAQQALLEGLREMAGLH